MIILRFLNDFCFAYIYEYANIHGCDAAILGGFTKGETSISTALLPHLPALPSTFTLSLHCTSQCPGVRMLKIMACGLLIGPCRKAGRDVL